MSRLISCALTADAVRARTKTVTRRLGWTFLKPGDTLTLCGKIMGRRHGGEPLERLAEVQVVDVRREPLNAITTADIPAEGLPGADTPAAFVTLFTAAMHCPPDTTVTRIAWEYR